MLSSQLPVTSEMLASSWLDVSWQAGEPLGPGLCDDSKRQSPATFPIDVGRFRALQGGQRLCVAVKKKKRKKKKFKKNHSHKIQVEKGDFGIKGNACYERWREVTDDLTSLAPTSPS